ncbi:MAG TPA: hypothetical protein VNA19_04015 [Pyrinomonadaceae bacterium]|jgi:hypothetical protein|nr:hypothetical protein [Pyrinomonadaceae bacterium]
MNCKQYRQEFEAADLDASAQGAALRHLRECAACRKFYEERLALRQLVAGLQTIEAPPDFEFRLRARMNARPGGGSRLDAWRRFTSPKAFAVALAACCVLVFAAAALRYRSNPTPGSASLSTTETTTTTAQNSPLKTPVATVERDRVAGNETIETRPQTTGDGLTAATEVEELKSVNASVNGVKSVRASFKRAHVGRASSARARIPVPFKRSGEDVAGVNGAQLASSDSAVRASQTLYVNEPVALPVNASAHPLRVVLRDEQGAARVVAIKSVSFGAQELVGRLPVNAPRATQAREGVW